MAGLGNQFGLGGGKGRKPKRRPKKRQAQKMPIDRTPGRGKRRRKK